MFELSRTVEEFAIVSLRGTKFIRCGRTAKPVGVYTLGGKRLTILLSGDIEETELPAGVISYGQVTIRAGGE